MQERLAQMESNPAAAQMVDPITRAAMKAMLTKESMRMLTQAVGAENVGAVLAAQQAGSEAAYASNAKGGGRLALPAASGNANAAAALQQIIQGQALQKGLQAQDNAQTMNNFHPPQIPSWHQKLALLSWPQKLALLGLRPQQQQQGVSMGGGVPASQAPSGANNYGNASGTGMGVPAPPVPSGANNYGNAPGTGMVVNPFQGYDTSNIINL
jgi:hypothetical protein